MSLYVCQLLTRRLGGHICIHKWDWNVRKYRHLLVYLDVWIVQKSLLYEQNLHKPLEIPIFQFRSRFKIQFDSFLTAFTALEN